MTAPAPLRKRFYRRLDEGWSVSAASHEAGVTSHCGRAWAKPEVRELWSAVNDRVVRSASRKGSAVRGAREVGEESAERGPVPFGELCGDALRALEDFEFFRLRYLGHVSMPWQVDAARMVLRWLDSGSLDPTYAVLNMPPGTGKTTLFTHDIPVWLTVRDRSIRGLVGSANVSLAERYLGRMRETLSATVPFRPTLRELRAGLAVDAATTLVADFGRFQFPGGRWSSSAFEVERFEGGAKGQKEPSWSAVGLNSAFIGGRYVFCGWDDVMEPDTTYSLNQMETLQRRWDSIAEERLDPGGVLLLPGQRLGPSDLYRYCLDKLVGDDVVEDHGPGCCHALPGRKYHHIIYRAHDDDRCRGEHREVAPWPDGCLLDPVRVSWNKVSTKRRDEESYLTTYQQEDADPLEVLVDKLWVSGGVDSVSGEVFPGCWDEGRAVNEVPGGLGPCVSVGSTDPSGSGGWACQWWLIDPVSNRRVLMNSVRRRMTMPDLCDWDIAEGRLVGLLPEWVELSKRLGRPIRHWVWEGNAVQKHLADNNAFRRFTEVTGCHIVRHHTGSNRNDSRFGVEALLRPLYRRGLVRLPGVNDLGASRQASMVLVDEVTKWRGDGKGYHSDAVMAQWFVENRLPFIRGQQLMVSGVASDDRPSWLLESV